MGVWPLAGLGVVEVGDSLAVRLCGQLLAQAGATVRRLDGIARLAGVAPLGANVSPHATPSPDPAWNGFLDRDKVAVAATSAAELDRELATADLFLSGLGHDAARPAGLDCTAVLERFPSILAACVTPLGQDGPYSGWHADEAVLCALSGLTDTTPGFPDRAASVDDPPCQSRAPLAELAGALTAAVAITGAIAGRRRGDGTRHVEVASVEAAAAMMVYEWGISSYTDQAWGRRPLDHVLPEPNSFLPCADGSAVVVAFRDEHWRELVALMGSPDWATVPEYADGRSRGANWRVLHEQLTAWSRTVPGRELMQAAQARGLPCSYAIELAETVASEQVRSRGAVEQVDGELRPADPVVVDGVRRGRMPIELHRRPRPPAPAPAPRDSRDSAAHETTAVPTPGAPLAGIRVIDLSHMIAGPVCGQLLSALGAEVILVESARYLVSRAFPPFGGEPWRDAGAVFTHVNRGKRSVEIDLTSGAGRDLLDRLVETADVVVENLSAPAAAKLGLGYERLAAVNDQIVLASISGLGRSGPWGDYAALHSSVIALSGLASATRDPSGRPRLVGACIPDPLSGTYAALAVQQALLDRERTGRGCHVEVAMLDVALVAMAGLLDPASRGEQIAPSETRFVRVADGWIVAPAGQKLDVDTGLDRLAAATLLQERGVATAPVLDVTEVMRDPHLTGRGFVVEVSHPVVGRRPLPAVPWCYDGERPWLGAAPLFGDSTQAVLTSLSELTPHAVDELRAAGAVG